MNAWFLDPTLTWFQPQTITVTAVNDFLRQGTHYDRITHQIHDGYTDAFLGVTVEDVTAGLAREINADVAQPRSAAVAYEHATIELVGTVREGDVWLVTVNGVRLDAVPVDSSANLNTVASDLASAIAGAAG